MNRSRQIRLLAEAKRHMPQGVAENYRYWGETATVFVERAEGCRIVDGDGNSFVDFRLGYGPIILGYRDPRIDEAVIRCIERGGTVTGFATSLDTEVVAAMKSLCPGLEKARFANSGTEAVMGAVRTARGFTGRDRIVIVEGAFHGLYDEMMWKVDVEGWTPGEGDPEVVAFGAGIPGASRSLMDAIPLNDAEALLEVFRRNPDQIAAVVLEPIMGNCGSISAQPAWLQLLRETCDAEGALLVMDEVKTGFRVAPGGAQESYGVRADLATYAKAMGNGYPIAAFGGRAEVMDVVGSHRGGVVHGGTYTGNLVGLGAAHATLDVLASTGALETVSRVGGDIRGVLDGVFERAGVAHAFAGPPSMFGVHLTPTVPTNYRDWKSTDHQLYARFAWNLIEGGVMLEPDSREPWFICEAHQAVDLTWLEEVATQALSQALEGR